MLLVARCLHRSFLDGGRSRTVLKDLSFTVDRGETVALWGPSGSGKSTLLNVVAGVLPVDSGQLELRLTEPSESFAYGQRSAEQTAALRRRHLGYVFQFFNLIPTLTVAENVALSLKLANRDHLQTAARERAMALGLEHRWDAYPEQLSGGEQQRAAIARALAPEPALVLADEPTGNLDAVNAAAVTEALWTQVAETGCALLIATHDPAIAQRADRRLDLS